MDSSLRKFFNPNSLVLLGASSKEGSIGYEILKSILKFGYTGKIFVLNPNSKEILGVQCNSTLAEISDKIDLAIILLPKKLVLQGFKECVRKGIKNVIVITAGFKEVGDEGAKLENELLKIAMENQVRLIGPNCMGVINTDATVKLNATFAAELPKHSKTAFLSQSGALAAAVLNTISQTGFSFGQFVSVGNKADVNENDLLDYWANDPNVDVITMYLESFEDGRKFYELAKRITPTKPIIVLKGACSDAGSKAAISHTGALASADKIVNTALKQCGAMRVETIEEMFETASAFQKFSLPKGNRVAVLTNAGGPGILLVDELERNNLKLSSLNINRTKRLREILLPESSFGNPIDMLPGATAQIYKNAAEIILEDNDVDSLIIIFVEPVMIDSFDVLSFLSIVQKNSRKPVLLTAFPLPRFWGRWGKLGDKETIIYKSLELPPKILRHLWERKLRIEELNANRKSLSKLKTKERDDLQKIFDRNKDQLIQQKDLQAVCKKLKLPIVKSMLVENLKEAKQKFKSLKFPIVLKVESPDVIHKSDIGGVITNIKNLQELESAFKQIRQNLKKKKIAGKNVSYLLQEFVNGGIEVIIGGFRDPGFGPVVMFGAGGKLVELIKDNNFALAPITKHEAEKLIYNSKIYPLLKGFRGEKGIDIKPIAEILLLCSELMMNYDEIKEFDINPLIVKPGRGKSKIVDMRIIL
ncbi:MAG: acetate--CoA ligase family protein [Bacteroidetes bacterium]|nr:acetate--CoA ligase family protein [Bacteroidota bacterium]